MDKALKIPNDQYRHWIAELSKRYQRSQVKAATSVNSEMMLLIRIFGPGAYFS